MTAADQSGVREIVDHLPVPGFLAGIEEVLHSLPRVPANQGFIRPLVHGSLPLEFAAVGTVPQHHVKAADIHLSSSKWQTFVSDLLGNRL